MKTPRLILAPDVFADANTRHFAAWEFPGPSRFAVNRAPRGRPRPADRPTVFARQYDAER